MGDIKENSSVMINYTCSLSHCEETSLWNYFHRFCSNQQATTTQTSTESNTLTFEQTLATLLKNLKISVRDNAAIKTAVEGIFDTITIVTKAEV